jgi:hypothetical protein
MTRLETEMGARRNLIFFQIHNRWLHLQRQQWLRSRPKRFCKVKNNIFALKNALGYLLRCKVFTALALQLSCTIGSRKMRLSVAQKSGLNSDTVSYGILVLFSLAWLLKRTLATWPRSTLALDRPPSAERALNRLGDAPQHLGHYSETCGVQITPS